MRAVEAETRVAAIGASRQGIVTAPLAGAAGVSPAAMSALRRRGVVVSIGRGVDRLRDHPWTWHAQLRAALDLAGPRSAAALRTAAHLHGFYAYRAEPAIEVVVPRGVDHRLSFARLVQDRRLLPEHVVTVGGFPVTTVARTCFDLCGDPDPGLGLRHPVHRKRMARVVNDALARRGLAYAQECSVLLAVGGRGRAGTVLNRGLLEEFGPDYEPTRSESESFFVECLELWGVAPPERQVAMADERGFIGVVDFLWAEAAVVVEIDSSWHDGPLDRLADLERDKRLLEAGYAVYRYRYGELVLEPARVRRELEAVLARRR